MQVESAVLQQPQLRANRCLSRLSRSACCLLPRAPVPQAIAAVENGLAGEVECRAQSPTQRLTHVAMLAVLPGSGVGLVAAGSRFSSITKLLYH